MKTGFRGTFVIPWSQTEVDGIKDAALHSLDRGVVWSWNGPLMRMDGPPDVWRLGAAVGEDDLRTRIGRKLRRSDGIFDDVFKVDDLDTSAPHALPDQSFVVTNGTECFLVTLIEAVQGRAPLLVFYDEIPPKHCDLWVIHHTLAPKRKPEISNETGVICFTPGTLIASPQGARPVETLRPGDLVSTKDSGAQPIEWIGQRRISGARLFAMPHLRPVRIHASALDTDRPEASLLVSPEHRVLMRGPRAQELFNVPEVLVAAKDLVNGSSVTIDMAARELTYIHLLLPRHEVIWANGLETESFHPANADLSLLSSEDRSALFSLRPELQGISHSYGEYARRNLSPYETALLCHAA